MIELPQYKCPRCGGKYILDDPDEYKNFRCHYCYTYFINTNEWKKIEYIPEKPLILQIKRCKFYDE